MTRYEATIDGYAMGDYWRDAYDKVSDMLNDSPFVEAEMRAVGKMGKFEIKGVVEAENRERAIELLSKWEEECEERVWVEMATSIKLGQETVLRSDGSTSPSARQVNSR